jgi:hypothetical protein
LRDEARWLDDRATRGAQVESARHLPGSGQVQRRYAASLKRRIVER